MQPLLLRPAPRFPNLLSRSTEKRPPRRATRPQRQVSFSVRACDANHPFGGGVPLRTPEPSLSALPVPARMRMCALENCNLHNVASRPVS